MMFGQRKVDVRATVDSTLTTFWEKRCNAPRANKPRASSSLEPAPAGMLFPTFQGKLRCDAVRASGTPHATRSSQQAPSRLASGVGDGWYSVPMQLNLDLMYSGATSRDGAPCMRGGSRPSR
jgi:hypothetical protein